MATKTESTSKSLQKYDETELLNVLQTYLKDGDEFIELQQFKTEIESYFVSNHIDGAYIRKHNNNVDRYTFVNNLTKHLKHSTLKYKLYKLFDKIQNHDKKYVIKERSFLFDELLIFGYLHNICVEYIISNDVIDIIVNHYGGLLKNCKEIDIRVSSDYVFDDKLCESLCKHWSPETLLQFYWPHAIPKDNRKILKDYAKPLRSNCIHPYITKDESFFNMISFPNSNAFKCKQNLINFKKNRVKMSKDEIYELCNDAISIFNEESGLLKIKAPIKVVADIHGQFNDLLQIFKIGGFPNGKDARYLFLGNYVDNKDMEMDSIETICLLLAYKIIYTNHFFMIRGSDEDELRNKMMKGFYGKCIKRYMNDGEEIWKKFNKVFNHLPLAAIIGDKIFCVHSGLSPGIVKKDGLKQIANIQRPIGVPERGLLANLLWAEPDEETSTWDFDLLKNRDSNLLYFGRETVQKFLKLNGFELMVRGHEPIKYGYESFFSGRILVTMFSAPNYKNKGYDGAVMTIDETLMCGFDIVKTSTK